MKIGSVYFEDTGYCGVFSNSLELIWSDNTPLFKHVLRFKDKFAHCLDEGNVLGSSEFVFKYIGRSYCAIMYNVNHEFVLCRVYPEICDDKLIVKLKDSMSSICCGTLNIMNLVGSIANSVRNDNTDIIPEYLRAQQEEAEIIYTETLGILDKFAYKSAAKFVHINSSVLGTLNKIEKMTKKFNRRIKYIVFFEEQYVKLDYPTFERAFYNLTKLFFKFGKGDARAVIRDYNGGSMLSVDFDFELGSYLRLDDKAPEKVGAENIFAAFGGETECTITDKEFRFHGSFHITSADLCEMTVENNTLRFGAHYLIGNDDFYELAGDSDDPHYFSSSSTKFEVPEVEDYGSIILKSLTKFSE